MADGVSSDVEIVSKLKRRLRDAHQQKQAVAALKVLNRLSLIHMTLEILKVTHIGKEVNSLRKWDGEVGDKARALVRKWKQLLPDSEPSRTTCSSTSAASSQPTVSNGRDEATGNHHDHKKKKRERSEDVDVHVTANKSSRQLHANHLIEATEFSRALMADHTVALSTGSTVRTGEHTDVACSRNKAHTSDGRKHKHKHKHHNSHTRGSQTAVSGAHISSDTSKTLSSSLSPEQHRSVVTSMPTLTRPDNPPVGRPLDIPTFPSGPTYSPRYEDTFAGVAIPRKRKANLESTLDSVALTKRSRTQVYSGKRSLNGPQAVPSLFEQSMKVLMDNIDDIGEVGGVPFFILEPVLQKCTPTQLMRLEEYNEHFLEDTDPLWEKHCLKEFKGCKPTSDQSWRELYIELLAEREEKLKKLSARIKAQEVARQEPLRKAKLADVSRMPMRRGRSKVTSSGTFKRGRFDEEPSSSSASNLKKQTMKMAKQMQLMKVYRPGRR